MPNNALGRNFTLFRPGQSLTSGKAVRLPVAGGWQEAGPDTSAVEWNLLVIRRL